MNPAVDLVTHLATALSLTTGTSIFNAPELPTDQSAVNSVFAHEHGGPEPSETFGGSAGRAVFAQVQVLVRNADYESGRAVARNARANSHLAPISGYYDIRVLTSEPLYLGKAKDDAHHRWSFTVEMRYQE